MRSDVGRTCINDTERVSARRRDRSSLSFLACSSKDARSPWSLDAPPRATRFAVLNDPSNIFAESDDDGCGTNDPTGRPADGHSCTGSQRRTSSESRFVATRAPRSSHSSGTGTRAPRLLLTPARRSKWEPERLLFPSQTPFVSSFARLPLSRVTSTLGLFPNAPRHTASRRSSFGASSVARASGASEGRGTRWRPRACAG